MHRVSCGAWGALGGAQWLTSGGIGSKVEHCGEPERPWRAKRRGGVEVQSGQDSDVGRVQQDTLTQKLVRNPLSDALIGHARAAEHVHADKRGSDGMCHR